MLKSTIALYNNAILSELLARYDVQFEDVRFVGGFDSYVYEFTREDLSYILKISHSDRRTFEELEEEIEWLSYLEKHNAPVCKVLPSAEGNFIETVALDSGSYFLATLYEKAIGRLPLSEDWNEQLFKSWGTTTGKLHKLASHYHKDETSWKRKSLFDEEYLNIDKYIPKDQQIVLDKSKQLVEKIQALQGTTQSYGIIHGDLHVSNFFIEDDRITVFDFDDINFNFFINDIAVIVFMVYWRPLYPHNNDHFLEQFLSSFLDAYQVEYSLKALDFSLIPDFLKLRHLIVYIGFLQTVEGQQLNEGEQAHLHHLRNVIEQDVPIIPFDFAAFLSRYSK
jgi:Ser/Thr protein kinase RdoA (MazF antagonist)